MISHSVKETIQKLSNDDLLDLLDFVSEEVKNRNSMIGPEINTDNMSTEEMVVSVIESLASLGISFKKEE